MTEKNEKQAERALLLQAADYLSMDGAFMSLADALRAARMIRKLARGESLAQQPQGEAVAREAVEQFKSALYRVPYFADRVNKATREKLSEAHSIVLNLPARLDQINLAAPPQAAPAAPDERTHHAALQRIGTALGLLPGSDLHRDCVPAIKTLMDRATGGDIAAGHFQYTEGRGWTEVQKQYAGEPGVVVLYHAKGWPARQSSASAQQVEPVVFTDAAAFIERKAEEYARDFGYSDMGSLSFGSGDHAQVKMDHYTSLQELADEIRSLAAPSASAQQTEPVDGCTEENCRRCRTPEALRTPDMYHAGLSVAAEIADEVCTQSRNHLFRSAAKVVAGAIRSAAPPSASPAPTDAQIRELGRQALGMPPTVFVDKIRALFAGAPSTSPVALAEDELRGEFERQHQGRNLKQHRLRGTYVSAPIAALWNQHKRTASWMRAMATAPVAASPADQVEDARRLDWLIRNEVQVWEVNRRYSVHEVTEHHAITGDFMTARDAIDAAMSASKEGA